MPTRPPQQRPATSVVARSLLATAETVGLAAAVHTHAGGHLPPALQLTALSAGTFLGALALLTGRARLWTIAPAVLVLQVLLHEGFTRLATGSDPVAAMPGMPTMHEELGPGTAMVLGHAVIGIVTVLVLLCQDQAVRVLAGLVSLLVGATPFIEQIRIRPTWRRVTPLTSVLLSAAPRRGPPVAVC